MFPLVGRALHRGARGRHRHGGRRRVRALIFGGFFVAIALNFLGIAGDDVFHTGTPVAARCRQIFVPVLPVELVERAAVRARRVRLRAQRLARSRCCVVLFVFQYLLRELLRSQDRAERLAALQIGVLTSMIETLALRDRMTARHSAAVARYARAIARRRRRAELDLVAHLRPAARHRQVRVPRLDPARRRAADRRAVGARQAPSRGRRADRPRAMELRPGRRDHPQPSRALGRRRLPARARRRGHPAPRAADRRRRRLRRAHRARLLPQAGHLAEAIVELQRCAGTSSTRARRDVRGSARARACRSATATTRTSTPSSRSNGACARTRAGACRPDGARVRGPRRRRDRRGDGEGIVRGRGRRAGRAALTAQRGAVRRARGALPLGRGRRRQPGGGRRLRDARPVAAPAGRSRDSRASCASARGSR